jgi:diketogulonate reductase-like aldo/keto reductase
VHFIEAHGARIPAIGLGTWPMRGTECARAVRTAIAAGYRHIDTASIYGNEDGVGEGMRASGIPRGEIFVTTKVWPTDIAGGALERSAEKSLRRLGTDYVDLLLIHWPSRSLSMAETIEPLNAARRRGLARHIGVSNFTAEMVEEAWRATREPLAANQCEYHPELSQEKVLAACRAHGMAFVSYTPLGRSVLFNHPVVRSIAERLGRSPAQIILRWHVQQAGVAAIPKAANRSHIEANIAIFDFELTDTDMAALFRLARHNGRQVESQFSPRWDS